MRSVTRGKSESQFTLRLAQRGKLALHHWQLYVLMLPLIVFFILFKYVPMYGIQIAFRDFSPTLGFWNSPWVGLRHFQRFFSSPDFKIVIKNTLTISLLNLAFGFPLPIIISLLLNQVRARRYKHLVQNMIYAPYFISTVVMVGILQAFLSPSTGIINQILIKLGGESIFFMGEPQYFKAIYVISEIWQTTGWGTVIYLAALSGVSPDLYEAAVVDGATKWQRMIRIDLPCIMPTAIIQLILSTGKMFSIGYEKIFLMQNSLNRTVSEVISTYEYKQGILQSQFGYSAAIGLFNAVINLVILLTVNYLANKYSETSLW